VERLFTQILRPVKRQGADRYLRLMLLSFAIAVVATRLFLSLTGYPQVGGSTLHIAHLLWGGLLLFLASLLPLMFANRWVYSAAGVMSGAGVGLFIDEVGKFITRTNNYFYPAAMPIIYAFFLLTVILYLRVRQAPSADPRAELYRIFDDMSEVLDRNLDANEQADLEARLKAVAAQPGQPEESRLAEVLLGYLRSGAISLYTPVPGPVARFMRRLRGLESRFLTRGRFRALLTVGLAAAGIFSIAQLMVLGLAATQPGAVSPEARVAAGLPTSAPQPAAGDTLFAPDDDAQNGPAASQTPGFGPSPTPAVVGNQNPGSISLPEGPIRPEARTLRARVAFWLRAGLEAAIGALLLAAALLLLVRREDRGLVLGSAALLVALTTLNLLVFYFDQFAAVMDALAEFGLYQALVHYRRRFAPAA
jgi:hypothetical protein